MLHSLLLFLLDRSLLKQQRDMDSNPQVLFGGGFKKGAFSGRKAAGSTSSLGEGKR